MRDILHSILFILLSHLAFTQHSIQGAVLDEEDGALIFATVALWQDSQLVKGVNTDLDGLFIFEGLAAGAYTLEVSYIGYANQKRTVLMGPVHELGVEYFHMQESAYNLSEIIVSCYNYRGCCTLWACGGSVTTDTLETESIAKKRNKPYDDETGATEVFLYPNPSSGQVHLELNEEAQVYISDGLGRLILQQKNMNKGSHSLDLSHLVSGAYPVIIDQKGTLIQTQLIIQKM